MRTTSMRKGGFIFSLMVIGLVCGQPYASAQTLNQKGRAFTSALEKVARSETAGKQLHGLAQRGDREGITKLLIQNGAPRDTIVTAVTPPQGTIPEKGTLRDIGKGLSGANVTVTFGGGKGTTVSVSGQPKGGGGTECTGSLTVGSNGQASVSAGCGAGSSSGSSKK
jgi:hypothetical protein